MNNNTRARTSTGRETLARGGSGLHWVQGNDLAPHQGPLESYCKD